MHSERRNLADTCCHGLHAHFRIAFANPHGKTSQANARVSNVSGARTRVEILSRPKPANSFGNAFAFHIIQAPTGASFQNLDATRRKSPIAPPSALSQAEPLSWLTPRLTTLLVLSNLPWQPSCCQGLTSSVYGSMFGEHQTTASVLSSLLPGYHTGSSQTGCDCLAAHGVYPAGYPSTAIHTNGRS